MAEIIASLAHFLPESMKAELMTCTAAHQQGMLKMFYLHLRELSFLPFLLFSILSSLLLLLHHHKLFIGDFDSNVTTAD